MSAQHSVGINYGPNGATMGQDGGDFLLRVGPDGALNLGRDVQVTPGADHLLLTSPHLTGKAWIGHGSLFGNSETGQVVPLLAAVSALTGVAPTGPLRAGELMTPIRQGFDRLRRWLRLSVENYRMVHVPRRCQSGGCDCPCGFCRHDARHVPGRPGA